MQIVRVQEKQPFVPIALSIDEDVDVAFLNEIMVNTYGSGAGAARRRPGSVGEGGIDAWDEDSSEYISPNRTGWLVLAERWAIFFPKDDIWREYERVED